MTKTTVYLPPELKRALKSAMDTGGLYAALDANEALHGRAVAALVASTPPRVISPFVLAELD